MGVCPSRRVSMCQSGGAGRLSTRYSSEAPEKVWRAIWLASILMAPRLLCGSRMPTLWRRRVQLYGGQLKVGDADGDIDADFFLDADRLQHDGAVGATEQNIDAHTDAEGRIG